MYRAKARGRNCFEIFRHDSDSDLRGRLDLEIELREAIEREELELHYQPIVSVVSGAVTGVEPSSAGGTPYGGSSLPATSSAGRESGSCCRSGPGSWKRPAGRARPGTTGIRRRGSRRLRQPLTPPVPPA